MVKEVAGKIGRTIALVVLALILIAGCLGFLATMGLLVTVMIMERDYNPPATRMEEYFHLHEDDFEAAIPLLLEQEYCQHTCTTTPEEIVTWAGPDAKLYLCWDKEAPPMYDIETGGGTFTYIPGQEEIPTRSWNPCVGVRARCSYMFAPGWFRCKRTFD